MTAGLPVRRALLAYVRKKMFEVTDDLKAGRIAPAEAKRRIKAAKLLIRGARDGETLEGVRAKMTAIFRPMKGTPQ